MGGLNNLTVENFKSIKRLSIDLMPLNIFIGANGAGKSNFVGIFKFLNELSEGNIQTYTGRSGGANSILYFGRKVSENVFFRLRFDNKTVYECKLAPTNEDRFIFQKENIVSALQNEIHFQIGEGYFESGLSKRTEDEDLFGQKIKYVLNNLRTWKVYHFHDTSDSALIKQTVDIGDNRTLRSDGGNLASFLYALSKQFPDYFENIQDAVRIVAPFFDRFILEPTQLNKNKIRLEWKHKGTSDYFNASSLSDGTLRFVCIATLLLQPNFPTIILLDEPELGLHPYAITVLGGLLRSAAKKVQVIVATQSVTLVNQFSPEDIVVVDRDREQSCFRRLDRSQINEWLENYGIGDLWEKNVFGGRP